MLELSFIDTRPQFTFVHVAPSKVLGALTHEDNNIRMQEALLASELEHLEIVKARQHRDLFKAQLTDHGKKLGGVWSALSKNNKPQDMIYRLKVLNSAPPQYERDSKRMAELSRNFHNDLQSEDLTTFDDPDEHERKLNNIIDNIPNAQRLPDPHMTQMNWNATQDQIAKAIDLGKNKTATGLDGCPYELWKALKAHHARLATQPNTRSFDIIKALTEVLADIQNHGVDPEMKFAHAWMCPAFKKKDPTEIGNYRPINILNTDYKILTKVMALQLNEYAHSLIHSDQAGFIPRRSIFNHIRLAKAIINYAEVTKIDGAIIALDQEKAYDKIRHDYLWCILEAFHLPPPFINTLKSLYDQAYTCVAINGVMSTPYQVCRGVRQGDPLSCPIFNLAIEPLACLLRNDPSLRGLQIPGLVEKIIAKFFADDTSLYLSSTDRFDHVVQILRNWCKISGAKFNIEKTEIIPIGTPEHRERILNTCKINTLDQITLDERIKIAADGEAIRFLGAWLGNNIDDASPWEPVLDNINKSLTLWKKAHPTMTGRKLIIQAVVGGHTQFLAKVQGMPENIVSTLTKTIRDFMWEEDSSPRIALDLLQSPKSCGGLNLLDIKACNEAIEIMWLKSYLNFSPSRPEWAMVTDLILSATARPITIKRARKNPFLQTWEAAKQGTRARRLNSDITRMLQTARIYNTNLAAIRMSIELRAQLPAWYHMASDSSPITNTASKCLLDRHGVSTIADMLRTSDRLRNQNTNAQHLALPNCPCSDCVNDRTLGCHNPHQCANKALLRIHRTYPKLNPLRLGDPHDNLSLTKRRKSQNDRARAQKGEILFDPSITCKEDLAECFRIFIDPNRLTNIPAQRFYTPGITHCAQTVTVFTDGACFNNGKLNAKCGSGVYFGPSDPRNISFRPSGSFQSNQAGEVIAILKAALSVPKWTPLKIISDSLYAINGLTEHLSTWEDRGWIGIKNAPLFKATACVLKQRIATTSFQWTKGHAGDRGNEEADRLAKEGANKPTQNTLHLDIPKEFDLQGAKLSSLSQAIAYQGIMERKPPCIRPSTDMNLHRIREALQEYHGDLETDETLWNGTRNNNIRLKVHQFLFKAIHSTQKVGSYWSHIPNLEDRRYCNVCNVMESMEHILLHCQADTNETIWQLARNIWPHNPVHWPHLNFGILLGCGAIHLPAEPLQQEALTPPHRPHYHKGATRLLQILLSESLHLIWVLRCERVMQEKTHSHNEIKKRWSHVINSQLTQDNIIASKVRRNKSFSDLVKTTWKPALAANGRLPNI